MKNYRFLIKYKYICIKILINYSGGTASYLLGMTPLVAAQGEMGNTPLNTKSLSLGWMMGFLFLVSFVGLFSILPLRRVHNYIPIPFLF